MSNHLGNKHTTKSVTPTGFAPPHVLCPHFSTAGHWVVPQLQALSCPGLCTSPKQNKHELQLVKHSFWHRKATKKQEDERVEGWLHAPLVRGHFPQHLALYFGGSSGMCTQPLGPLPGDVSQTNRPHERSWAQAAAFPLQMLFLGLFSLCPARSFHKICWNFSFCHLLPPHH